MRSRRVSSPVNGGGIDNFHYTVTVLCNGTVVDSFSTTAWGSGTDLKTTGWQTVSLDLTGYEGKTLQTEVSAGGTYDTAYPTWVYFDGME